MKILRLVWQEIWHRKLTFCLALMAIAMAVGYAVYAIASIQIERKKTEQHVAALDDEIRKITKAMGFNINILPAELNLQGFYSDDFAKHTMPYEFVQRLADSKLVKTLNHLRPALIQKVHWQEKNRDVILMGVSGVIPWTHRTNKKPLSEPVKQGEIH